MPLQLSAQIIAARRAGRARSWRSARSSFRTSPTAGGRSSRVRIAMPDQMCQSVWWFLTDHQLNAISPASSQWTSRIGRSQTGCLAPGRQSVVHLRRGSCRGTPCRSCRGRRSVALIAAMSPLAAAALKALAAPWKVCELGGEILRILPDFGLGAGLADVGPGAWREPAATPCATVRRSSAATRGPRQVRRAAGQFAVKPFGLADRFHALVPSCMMACALAPASGSAAASSAGGHCGRLACDSPGSIGLRRLAGDCGRGKKAMRMVLLIFGGASSCRRSS